MSQALLPEHKADVDKLPALAASLLTDEQLPPLLEWLQDMNWPVAEGVSHLLSAYPAALVPHINNVLHSGDAIWIYNVLNRIVLHSPPEVQRRYRTSLSRLATAPTDDERDEEVDLLAAHILGELT